MIEIPNRGKRSVALNLSTDAGRALLDRLVATADVFLTSFLPGARQRLRIDVDDIRAANPSIIYVRGHGLGAQGPERDRPGYDATCYWSRSGVGDALTPADADHPAVQRPGFGDVMGGLALASGIAGALFSRERTGEPSVVDVSLLGTGMWNVQPDVIMTKLFGMNEPFRYGQRGANRNPLVGQYPTQDGRWIALNMMQSDRFWPDLCAHLDAGELVDDPRFASAAARAENGRALVERLDAIFRSRPLADWRQKLADLEGAWSPLQRVTELDEDTQVQANGYLRPVTDAGGNDFSLVAAPVQFDESPPDLRRAPGHGEHTDEILLELGLTMDEIVEQKVAGAVG
jgi:crotonobetainyl-CoA:carnitine CoA-transferase CaiB-like acyl-CoA transferase